MDNTYNQVPQMFTYKVGDKNMFAMGEKYFYLTDEEIANMQINGATRDDIISYVFEFLSKKRLADFSEMHNLFNERLHG